MTFDGPGISVFEVKREIIHISQLGDGTDFDLAIYNEDTNDGKCLMNVRSLIASVNTH